MHTIDRIYELTDDFCYLFVLIYVLISVVLREEMLTCFGTFVFIKCILVSHFFSLVVEYIKVYGTCKESCSHKE